MTTAVAKPTTPAQFEEYLNGFKDAATFSAALADGSFKENLRNYQAAQHLAGDLNEQIATQVQMAVAEMAKNVGGKPTGRPALGQRVSGAHNRHAPGAGLDGVFDSASAFMQNVLGGMRNVHELSNEGREKFEKVRNYTGQTGEGGGFLVPEEFRSEIFSGPELESAIVRPNATVVPMGSKTLRYPAVDFSTEVGEIWGGIIFYWMDEQGTIPDTSATFAEIEFTANRLAGAAKVPNDLLKDAAALDAWLRSNLPRGIREFEERAFLKGDGVKKPLGALHASNPALVVAGDESGQSTAGITWNNVLAMASRLLPESWDRAIWVITPDALPEIMTMAVSVGTGGSAVMIEPGGGTASPRMTLLGRPIRWSRKAPAAMGTQGDINLVDFSLYGIGDRQDVRLETSEHAFFFQDQTAFKVIERVDGQPLLLAPLTPENGGPTLSAFIQLETRSTD